MISFFYTTCQIITTFLLYISQRMREKADSNFSKHIGLTRSDYSIKIILIIVYTICHSRTSFHTTHHILTKNVNIDQTFP